MSLMKISAMVLGSMFVLFTIQAQPAPNPARPPAAGQNRGGFGIGGGPQRRPQQLEAIKDQLEVSDDDWKMLSPKVEKVLDAKDKMSTGAGMGWSSQNGGAPVFKPSNFKPDSDAGKALQDVRDAVKDEATSNDDLLKKMAAVREAKEKARSEFEEAQKELLKTLTPRQQAILMTLGVAE